MIANPRNHTEHVNAMKAKLKNTEADTSPPHGKRVA
jgi:hypothetical protein